MFISDLYLLTSCQNIPYCITYLWFFSLHLQQPYLVRSYVATDGVKQITCTHHRITAF